MPVFSTQRALVAFDCCCALLIGTVAASSGATAAAAGAAAASVILPFTAKLHIAAVFLLYNVALDWLQTHCDEVAAKLGLRDA